ncbi:kinase-like protein [Atractiella rhizophila]|nr:kinase-like protein [Atractiella rhizophila]
MRRIFSHASPFSRASRSISGFSSTSIASSKTTTPGSPSFVKLPPTPRHEETVEDYVAGGFHPMAIGQVFNQKYEVVSKLGWGRFSTVWLVKDATRNTFSALKVLRASCTDDPHGLNELEMLTICRGSNPAAKGYGYLLHLKDHFRVEGPNGTHVCHVTDAFLTDTLRIYRGFQGPVPLPVVKRIFSDVLHALSYLHEDCKMVHTDIKFENIVIDIPIDHPEEAEQTISLEELMRSKYKLIDVGHANKSSHRFAQMIQPTPLRAPEVIIDAEWDTKADIWNFGCLLFQMVTTRLIFDPFHQNEISGLNAPQTHMCQIISLLGNFPKDFVREGNKSERYFDADGKFLLEQRLEKGYTIIDVIRIKGNLPEAEISGMADFLGRCLEIDPQTRWSANQLLQHPWIAS